MSQWEDNSPAAEDGGQQILGGAQGTEVVIYCDGACRGNPGVGGYGAIVQCGGGERTASGAERETTNNRMELTAAIEALRLLPEKRQVRVYTDSKYVKNGMTTWIHDWLKRGWKTAARKAVRNKDLWQKLHALCQEHNVEWEWVPGHSGYDLNERCDQLANEAIDQFLADR